MMTTVSNRKRIWGWWFFDWASQPYHTLLVTFIFGPFFAAVAADYFMGLGTAEPVAKAQAQTLWARCMTITGLTIGLLAPFIGAIADASGSKLRWVFGFSLLYVLGAFGLWFMAADGTNLYLMLVSFGIGFIGAEFAAIFVNAQLPGLSKQEDVGAVSGSGFAFGYLGGVLALFFVLMLLVEQPDGKTIIGLDPIFGLSAADREGTRAVGPFTALWFLLFIAPYALWVREPVAPSRRIGLITAGKQVLASIKALRERQSLGWFLGASMLYRDALNGLYMFGGVYARLVLGWDIASIGIFGIIAAISAALFSWLGGKVDRHLGPKPVILGAIWVLILVSTIIVSMSREQFFGIALQEGSQLPDALFFICGVLIGGFGGILQASSRSLMVRHTRVENAAESFGLYGLSGRATAFLAPLLIGIATAVSESARLGIMPVIALFVFGLLLLRWVRAEGDQV